MSTLQTTENGSSPNSSNPLGILLKNCRTGPYWPEGVCVFANLCGLTSTCIWFIVLFPQIWKNWRRKSVQGLSVLWATANFTASLVNLFFVFSVSELPVYSKVDAVYMPCLELIILIQFVVYGNHFSTRAKLIYAAMCAMLWTTIILVDLFVPGAYQDVQWLAITLWCIETFPQVMLNMKLHSTSGQSTLSVVISLVGKMTDFLSTYLLELPLQFVIMAYFSSSMAYVNGLQVAWYIKSRSSQAASDPTLVQREQSYRSYQQDFISDGVDTSDITNAEYEVDSDMDTDAVFTSLVNVPREIPTLNRLNEFLRIISLAFMTAVLLGFIGGLIWNTASFISILAPGGIILILGCSFVYYNWCKGLFSFRRPVIGN